MDTDYSKAPLGENDEMRLWDYIDGISSTEENTVIENLINTQAAWQAKYSELLEVHQLMQSSEMEQPSLRFTKNVMDEIARLHIAPAARTYINKNIIRGIAFFFITLIIGFMIYGFGQVEWTSGDSKSVMPVDLAKVDYGKFFNNTYVNAFMIVNVVLGLFLLDRYLANKRRKMKESG
jgi:hypothetical protein